MTFGLHLMISSVAPTRLSTFYAYLITKMGNRNLNVTIVSEMNQTYLCSEHHFLTTKFPHLLKVEITLRFKNILCLF